MKRYRANTNKKNPRAITLAAALAVLLAVSVVPLSAFAAVLYMPDVTAEMSSYQYWAKKTSEPDRVLASPEEIGQINRDVWAKSKETRDLANWSEETFDATAYVKGLVASAEADGEYLYNIGSRYYPDGTKADSWEDLYRPLIDLCIDPDAGYAPGRETAQGQGVIMQDRYAVCTTRTSLRVFPTDQPLQDDPSDPDFDNLYLTMVKVNEPMIIKTRSADGQYYQALTSCGSGWIPAADVAICKDRAEWLDAWNTDNVLVVYADKIYTEDSRFAPETANRKLPMGTCLPLASEDEIQGRISNRTAHNNHVVWMPVRNEDGSFRKELALIGENRKVSEGYLPLTTRNVLMVTMNQLGDTYGWGSMLGSEDCSGYIRDVYRCFGLDMPRSSNRVNGVLKNWDMGEMTDAQKLALIKKMPPGTILTFPGHEMIYLGREGDKLYVISSVSNVRLPGDSANTRVRGCVINTLDLLRASNTTWLHNLTYVEIPYYGSAHEDPVFENPVTVQGNDLKVKAGAVRKGNVSIPAGKAFAVTDAKGKVTYKKISGDRRITVAKNGRVTVKQGLKKGTYEIGVSAKAGGNARYGKTAQETVLRIKVK